MQISKLTNGAASTAMTWQTVLLEAACILLNQIRDSGKCMTTTAYFST